MYILSFSLTFTLETLFYETIKQGTAVVAESEPLVAMHDKPMRNIHVEPLGLDSLT